MKFVSPWAKKSDVWLDFFLIYDSWGSYLLVEMIKVKKVKKGRKVIFFYFKDKP
jgi:hypothetical protein